MGFVMFLTFWSTEYQECPLPVSSHVVLLPGLQSLGAQPCPCIATGRASLGLSFEGCMSGFWLCSCLFRQRLSFLVNLLPPTAPLVTFLLGFVESSLYLLSPRHDLSIWDRYRPHYTNGQWVRMFHVQPPSQLWTQLWDQKPRFFCCSKALWI